MEETVKSASMQQLLLIALTVGLVTTASASTTAPPHKDATYWITMTNKLRPGHPLDLNVQILSGSDPVEVTLTIMDSSGENTIMTSTPTSVAPGDPQIITIDIPMDIKKPSEERYNRRYKVQVAGVGRTVNFKEETYLNYEEKSFSIFIQTDKAVYKPRQTVKFRVLAMLPDMKVIRDQPMDIVIKDPKGNRIRQYLDVKDPNGYGVVELTFNLADGTPSGEWIIHVKMMDTEEVKSFDVDDYVLPRFEVEVKLPPFGLVSDSVLPITAKATYTFGQPVTKGTVDILVTSRNFLREGPESGIRLTGTLDKNGEYSTEVSTKRLLVMLQAKYSYFKTLDYRKFEVYANVTETDTGRKLSGESEVQYYMSPLSIKFLEISPNNFKPGLDYTGYLEVTKKDGSLFSAAEVSKIRIKINVTYEVELQTTTTITPTTDGPVLDEIAPARPPGIIWHPHYPRTRTVVLTMDEPVRSVPETGWITVTFTVPEDAMTVDIRAEADEPYENDRVDRRLGKSISPTSSYLQLKVPTEKPKVGETINVHAKATGSTDKLQYQVYSKGMLVDQGTVTARPDSPSSGPRAFDFSLTVTQAMAPSMTLLAFYVREDNDEFVVDAISLSVEGLFQKPVTIEFSAEKLKPGEPVDVIIKAAEESLVYFLIVDKSVKLLKGGNDITQDTVREELVEYDYGSFYPWMRYMFICGWPSYYGGNDAASVFDNANVLVITDGLLFRQTYNDRYPEIDTAVPGGGIQEVAGAGGGSVNRFTPAETVRKYFPENWLWEISFITPDSGGQVVVSSTAPDTITTWLASVFSVHPTYGLSVGAEPAELTTFRDVFVTLDLPLTIIRDEDYCFTATVFSYYAGELPVLLTLDKSDSFSNLHVKLDGNSVNVTKENVYYSYFLGFLEQNDAESVKFCFTPSVIGDIPVRVSALTNVQGLSDAVERMIRVKPEGVPRSTSFPYLIDLSTGTWSQDLAVDYPPNTVDGSQKLTVSIAGNLLGPAFENLDDLLRQPYGCGEQNMLNFAPNTYLIDFFYKTGLMTDEILQRTRDYMLIGYQKEIKYEHRKTGGGFSAFGDRDGKGQNNASLWLTAFVTRCFAEAVDVNNMYNNSILELDLDIISRSAMWMTKNQDENGTFIEYGKVFHKDMQGGSAEGEALTAYSLIALHEASKVLPDEDKMKLHNSIRLATEFLERRLSYLTDPYDICITAYALHLVNSPSSVMAFNSMQRISILGGGMLYWARANSVKQNLDRHAWSASADSISIEMTAYALLTYAHRGIATTQGLPIVRWMSNQRGPNGGFISTQDTVVGLQALSTVAASLYSTEDIPITVTISYTDSDGPMSQNIKINKANELLLQTVNIPYKNNLPSSVTISAATDSGQTGQSAVVAEVVLDYNVQQETRPIIYEMSHRMTQQTHGFELFINVRTVMNEPSSMSILEVDIPAGHSPETESLTENKYISRVEVTDDKLILYFETDVIDMRGVNVRIIMATTGGVLTKAQPRSYRVYNYYDSDQELTKTYVMEPASFCDKVPDVGACPYRYA